jgi:hypothetical protein
MLPFFALMDQLFAIDGQARAQKLTQSDRHLLPKQKARPLLDQIKRTIEAARVQTLPSSALTDRISRQLENRASRSSRRGTTIRVVPRS